MEWAFCGEEELELPEGWGWWVAAVGCVLDASLPKHSPNWIRTLLPRHRNIRGPKKLPPLLDTIISNQFQTDNQIRDHKLNQTFIKRFSPMLLIKLFCLLLCEPCHFNITNGKSILFYQVNYLSWIHVTIWFYHGECFSFLCLEFWFGELICILYHFELPGKYIQNGTNKNVFKLHTWVLCLFQKGFTILYIKHLYCFVFQVVCEIVCSDDWCCVVVPFDNEDVSVFVDWHFVIKKCEKLTK